jgi:sec-independent protein translocase protein TatC
LAFFWSYFLVSVAPLPGTTSNSIAYQVFVFLQAPLAEILNAKGGGRMIFTALHEGFFTQIKVGFFTCALYYLSNYQYAAVEIRGPRAL